MSEFYDLYVKQSERSYTLAGLVGKLKAHVELAKEHLVDDKYNKNLVIGFLSEALNETDIELNKMFGEPLITVDDQPTYEVVIDEHVEHEHNWEEIGYDELMCSDCGERKLKFELESPK